MSLIGERIKQARKAKGITQTQLANMVGVSPATMSGWESDTFQPSKKHQAALALALDVSEAYILYGSELPIAALVTSEEFKCLAEKTFKDAFNLYVSAGWLSVKRPNLTLDILMDVYWSKLLENAGVPEEEKLKWLSKDDE